MKCKKAIMGIAALLIVFFHLYIPYSHHVLELSIQKAAYIGVDLFFFLSAYSLGKREQISYFSFIRNRFFEIYVPFLIFTVIASLYRGWKLGKFFWIITGAEFFRRGGGAFLWFIPAIMIVYLIGPFLLRWKQHSGVGAFGMMVLGWLALVLLLQYGFHYEKIFILLNRLPIIFVGLYYDDLRKVNWGRWKMPLILILGAVGIFLLWKYGSMVRLNRPWKDFYYVAAIPGVVALAALCDFIAEKVTIRNVPLRFLGEITFELYAFQMIFGYDLEILIMGQAKNGQVSFILTCLILLGISYLFHKLRILVKNRITFRKKHLKTCE